MLGKEEVTGSGRLGFDVTVEQGRASVPSRGWLRLESLGFGNPLGQPGDLRDGKWHHVTIAVQRPDGATISATIDGSSYFGGGVAPLLGSLANGAPLRWEASPGSPEGRFKGQLDEVVIYRQALTAAQSQSAYWAGGHGHCRSEFVLEPVRPGTPRMPLDGGRPTRCGGATIPV